MPQVSFPRSIGVILLCVWLMVTGLVLLGVGINIPGWFMGVLAIGAGLLILVGL